LQKIIPPCGLHCIKINHLSVSLGNQQILNDISLHIHCGTLNAVIGRNGAGKSTLIRAILGDIPHTGHIEFKDREDGRIQKMKIGYVPQSLNIEKQTPVSVYDMIAAYHSRLPVCFWKGRKLKAQILEALDVFEAGYLLEQQVCNLSGGELQRVLLSMAVMDAPNLLLLDEPVSGIDQKGMDLFYQTIYRLKQHYDLAVILVSHDLDYVKRYADHVILLDKAVIKQGSVQKVFQSREFAEAFQGNLSLPEAGGRISPKGDAEAADRGARQENGKGGE
jgi:ABC-type Mn2+/Zn2+ transport system ATPase subunit